MGPLDIAMGGLTLQWVVLHCNGWSYIAMGVVLQSNGWSIMIGSYITMVGLIIPILLRTSKHVHPPSYVHPQPVHSVPLTQVYHEQPYGHRAMCNYKAIHIAY